LWKKKVYCHTDHSLPDLQALNLPDVTHYLVTTAGLTGTTCINYFLLLLGIYHQVIANASANEYVSLDCSEWMLFSWS